MGGGTDESVVIWGGGDRHQKKWGDVRSDQNIWGGGQHLTAEVFKINTFSPPPLYVFDTLP